ncbi:MAG: MAPEG family protein [Hyphomonadaceae bacterium]
MYDHGLLAPVTVLIAWTMLMLLWLYATRIPAMLKLKIDPEKHKDQTGASELLPVGPRRVAANYNHLHEQPTIFYAVAFVLQLLGEPSEFVIGVAWTYVALRILHSLVQATANVIRLRFLIFVLASIALGVLIYQALIGVGIAAWF